jgi:hypothetical protein
MHSSAFARAVPARVVPRHRPGNNRHRLYFDEQDRRHFLQLLELRVGTSFS